MDPKYNFNYKTLNLLSVTISTLVPVYNHSYLLKYRGHYSQVPSTISHNAWNTYNLLVILDFEEYGIVIKALYLVPRLYHTGAEQRQSRSVILGEKFQKPTLRQHLLHVKIHKANKCCHLYIHEQQSTDTLSAVNGLHTAWQCTYCNVL